MNHNPHNLKVGDVVMLDGKHEVEVIGFRTEAQIFTVVKSEMSTWDVMTNRLKPIK